MRKIGTWIVMTGFLLIAVSIVAYKENPTEEKEEQQAVMTSGAEYGKTSNPETETTIMETTIETTEVSGITGDIYTDARNSLLYMSISDGVVVDFDGNVLDQYSGITCLENGALVTEDGEIIENLFVGTKEQIYYALSGAVETGTVVEVELIIANQTGTDIYSFYASPAGTDQWGENLLEENVLCAWDNTSVKCKVWKDTLRWDFALEDTSGNREEIYDVDLSSCREDFIHLELWRDEGGGSAYVELY